MNLTTRILILSFISVLVPLLILSFFLKEEITRNILREKEDKLFGLAVLLDNHLEGTFDDILAREGAADASRREKIRILNRELSAVTDFVASGNPGVGVGYYNKALDAILTYGPSEEFQYTVGQSIFPGHQGYEVMETGKPMVQIGELVRGKILNCMWPIVRGGTTIGYIWSNETVDRVEEQMRPIINRVYGINILIFILIYASVSFSTRFFLDKILRIKRGIEELIDKPTRHIPSVTGELSIIANTINELVDSVSFMKSYNKYILEGVMNGVLAVSMDGRITRANKAFFQLFPEFPESSLGLDFKEAFKDGEMRDLIDGSLSRNLFYTNREIVLEKKVLEIYSNSITDEDGRRLGIVFVFRDKTVIREYEAALLEKERVAALGEMALSVVHEIKNPLTSVKGFAQLLRHPGVTEEKRLQYIGLIDTELNRVNRLLNEMLVYGGRAEPDLRPEDLLRIVGESAARIDWEQAGISFSIEPESGLNAADRPEDAAREDAEVGPYSVMADKYKIMQVFDNILTGC